MLKCARSREAKEFGAHVNLEKIAWMDATHEGSEYAHFLGLTIDLRCVSVERSEPGLVALTTNNKRSLHSSLTYLNWRFRLRLADYLLDLTLLGIKTVSHNACAILEPTLERALSSASQSRSEQNTAETVDLFVVETMFATLQKFQTVNGRSEQESHLLREIWQVVKAQFKKHEMSVLRLERLIAPNSMLS
ncbi:hypothetical protein HF325_000565 [Metschnikowia pulcherrima]|uniref:Uncharacterized protein n=1 Tax=Metschnikowia pulcherrima TaxID=27326 RepID=A0A8H7H0H1_9ASCO|nr:hypothetical protein HF325_000565 [Metschnikowia pulcherrima]